MVISLVSSTRRKGGVHDLAPMRSLARMSRPVQQKRIERLVETFAKGNCSDAVRLGKFLREHLMSLMNYLGLALLT